LACVFRRKRRFRRLLPALFLVTALLAGLGGALYAPNNIDALAYRFPRVLHWLSAEGWHWVASPTMQVNYSGTVYEWLMTPLYLFTRRDRLFFLIDWISYLFLPGLIFSVFLGCGISRRVAWAWMWLLPMGFCYVMQAGSIGNDLA
jgi:peptidoglycan/LPS O-acetylase OafA/YrhL